MSEHEKALLTEIIVSTSLGFVFFIAFWLICGGYHTPTYVAYYSDGAFLSAGLLLAFCGLRFATRGGSFDVLGYSAYALFLSFRPRPTERRYKTAGDYQQGMNEKRKRRKAHYLPWLINAGAYLLLALILLVVWHSI